MITEGWVEGEQSIVSPKLYCFYSAITNAKLKKLDMSGAKSKCICKSNKLITADTEIDKNRKLPSLL